MKRTKPDLRKIFKLPNPGLRSYLFHNVVGSAEIIRPPFWEGESPNKVVDRWSDQLLGAKVDTVMPGLEAYELEMRSKIGPLSVQLPLDQRLESIEHYYSMVDRPGVPIDVRAVKAFQSTLVPVRGVRLRNQVNTAARMRLSTNSGNPYFIKRRLALSDTRPVVIWPNGDQTLSFGSARSESWPCVATLGWRGQEGGPEPDDVKQRVVFMFPLGVNICELQFYQPAIEAWQKCHINSAYESMRAVEVKITKLFDTKGDDFVVVTDFSKFDQHFNSNLQNAARDCLVFMLGEEGRRDTNFNDPLNWINSVFPLKYNIPLLCSEDLMYEGAHGMGSGSGGTNFDECCAHGCMQHEAAILKGATLNPYSNAYGDDGYLSYKGIDVDDVISAYTSHGQEMNPDKQSADKHSAVYLRRYFHASYRDSEGIMLGVYSTFRALGRLLYQERYYDPEVWSKEMVILRALSIIENCANSPVFERFVDFCITGDKYKLGLLIPGFFDGLGTQVKRANEMIPDFLGYTKILQGDVGAGIQNWKVVKYLKSKA
uniref:RNA-dependent RNA polymerase n=1 Tax=Rabbit picobirnavirus 5 TaxID=2716679 RepID=A0A6G7PS24_9VIRU|nr:RNA-dependent RNA polymerase [Rabbit picobirnavirus 5]